MKPWARLIIPGALIVLFVFLAYLPAMQGGFVWDDDAHISANKTLRSLQGLWEIWFDPGATCQYYPLSFTGFWIGFQLWGLDPLGYHLLNVVMHSLVAVLLWQVLTRLKARGAWLAAAIFALHPVCVMSVAWMTELKNTLSASLALGAGWAYLRFAGLGVYERLEPGRESGRVTPCAPVAASSTMAGTAWRVLSKVPAHWCFYALSLVLFQLGLFAKTAISFLPVSLLLVTWWQRERLRWRDVWPLIPMLGIVGLMGGVTIYVEHHLVGATGQKFNIPLLERALISGRSFWFYLGKLFFPYRLTFIYERWKIDPGVWWQYVYPVATVGFLAGLWGMRGRIGKGPFVALLHFYVCTSLLILLMVLYMTRYSFVSDHWQYFGCLSVVALAAAGITAMLDPFRKRRPFLKPALCGALLVVLGALTWRQAGIYRDPEILYRDTLIKNPDCWLAHNNLGHLLLNQGRTEDAMEHYHKAIQINPNYYEGQYNIGSVLSARGQLDEAIEYYRKALQINPDYPDALNNLGIALAAKGRFDEAIKNYYKALQVNPYYFEALNNLGVALAAKGRSDEAIDYYYKALQINPDYPDALNNLGIALAAKGRSDEAIENYYKAVQVNPNNFEALNNLGVALAAKGRSDEAIEYYRKALQINPNYCEAMDNLGTSLAAKGRFDEAIENYYKAIQINSNHPETFFHLGMTLGQLGRTREAVAQYRQALRLNPDLAGALNNLAWILAASYDDGLRNGAEAVRLAEHACELTHYAEPLFIGTLAAAYAEAGRFPEAVTTAEKAEQLAIKVGLPAVAAKNRQLLELYRAGKPYHESPPPKP